MNQTNTFSSRAYEDQVTELSVTENRKTRKDVAPAVWKPAVWLGKHDSMNTRNIDSN